MPVSSSAKDYSSRSKSTQYDFSRFEPAKQSATNANKKTNPSPPHSLRVVETPARQRQMAQRRSLAVHIVLSAVLLVGLILAILYSRAILATINENIGVKTELLNTLNGEYTRLQTELDAKISLRNIEEYASANLGMSKVDQGQVQYINVEQGESVTLYRSSGENSLFDKVRQWFSKIFGHIQGDS